MGIRKYLLFTAPAVGDRKNFSASFDSREEAIEAAGKLKGGGGMWWQVIETATAECVAEDPGRKVPPVDPTKQAKPDPGEESPPDRPPAEA